MKNRNRSSYKFANINLLGKCNVDCFFCLGKDIPELLGKHNQLNVSHLHWKNFDLFLEQCRDNEIKKLYLTGQNTDALCYVYRHALIKDLTEKGFQIGLRTNGYLLHKNIPLANYCELSTGVSIHSLDLDTIYRMIGRKDMPDWDTILPKIKRLRISIVLNRYNQKELYYLLAWLSLFDNVRYVQIRRISTDTRDDLSVDQEIYDYERKKAIEMFPLMDDFYGAKRTRIYGMEVCWWPTIQTSINSMNYFTDGTISDSYFVVEGYLRNYQKHDAKKG